MKLNNFRDKKRILTLLLFFMIFLSVTSLINIEENSRISETNLNTSDTITINSPINGKAYTAHMDGFYRAPYSFELEEEGVSGADIEFIDNDYSTSGCSASVVNEIDGHQKESKDL